MPANIASLRWAGVVTLVALSCTPLPEGPKTLAPLCYGLTAGKASAKELFTNPVVPTDKVQESLIFGGMDPGTLEPINYELGFLLNDLNVPLSAPTDLYVSALEYTRFTEGWRAGETDYSISFTVCSDDSSGETLPAVEGEFAHITTLSADLKARLDSPDVQCTTDSGGGETVDHCRLFIPADAEKGIVIAAGTNFGTAGGTGTTSYKPGFDFNMLDTRFPNSYINPNRLGGETGMGKYFRYGACVYEYFNDPSKSAYLAKVGQNGNAAHAERRPLWAIVDRPGRHRGGHLDPRGQGVAHPRGRLGWGSRRPSSCSRLTRWTSASRRSCPRRCWRLPRPRRARASSWSSPSRTPATTTSPSTR